MAKYFPLEVIDKLNELGLNEVDKIFSDILKAKLHKEIDIDVSDDTQFINFCFSEDFLDPLYAGKYKDANDFLLYDKGLHKTCLPAVKFSDVDQRQTEWRDMFGQSYVLQKWAKSKIVYKIDNDFFHEIKRTKNLKFSIDMLSHLPVNNMYFDLSDVKGIGDFYGAWVEIYNVEADHYMIVIYMIMKGNQAFFSYYCNFDFYEDIEIELDTKDFLDENIKDTYFFQNFDIRPDGRYEYTTHDLSGEEDYRPQIIIAICQILEFLHAQIDDISENEITKSTYKPSPVVKNKFSEVRQWDVGIRYGKAIRFAKKEIAKETERIEKENKKSGKARKPVRPHIRSAHWQRYHVGEGRKQIKVNWIPPIYVCGTKEIPVTIRKIGA